MIRFDWSKIQLASIYSHQNKNGRNIDNKNSRNNISRKVINNLDNFFRKFRVFSMFFFNYHNSCQAALWHFWAANIMLVLNLSYADYVLCHGQIGWIIGQGLTVLVVGAAGDCLDVFFRSFFSCFFSFSLSLSGRRLEIDRNTVPKAVKSSQQPIFLKQAILTSKLNARDPPGQC